MVEHKLPIPLEYDDFHDISRFLMIIAEEMETEEEKDKIEYKQRMLELVEKFFGIKVEHRDGKKCVYGQYVRKVEIT